MSISLKNPERTQTLGEELANSISHGVALLAAITGSVFIIIHAAQQGDSLFMVSSAIFSASMIFLYLSSTLYHAMIQGRAKRIFRIIEHSAIFVLIAGTYTPFSLGILYGDLGLGILLTVWLLAVTGILLKIISNKPHPILSTVLYLFMGWLIVIAIDPLMASLPTIGFNLLLAGGLCYTLGVLFFATDGRLRYGHFIWHLFVIAGTVCHYLAVYWYSQG